MLDDILGGSRFEPGMQATRSALRAEGTASRSAEQVQILEQRLERLALRCQALWEIVRDNTTLSDADLQTKITEVDQRDGRGDGRIGSSNKPCPQCGRPYNMRLGRCQYCGTAVEGGALFAV